MKTKQKQSKLLTLFVSLTLIFLCVFGGTYAYFTATSTVNGTAQFSSLEVKFGYKTTASSALKTINETSFVVYPNATSITRGATFKFKVNAGDASEIYSLNFTSSGTSCSAYIRYWVDAYVVNGTAVDKTTNYGRYFQINCRISNIAETKTVTNSQTGVTNVMYYYISELSGGGTSVFADSMTLLQTAPDDVMQKQFQITISFDAVQSANKAFQSYYTDGWGYGSSWT